MTDPFRQMSPGIGNVGSYQVSGYPFVTGSTLDSGNFAGGSNAQGRIVFPQVVKSFTLINTSTSSVSLRLHYNTIENNNVIGGHHYITITGSMTAVTMNMKCKEIFVSLNGGSAGNGTFEIFADLTGISPNDMPLLTGSGLTI